MSGNGHTSVVILMLCLGFAPLLAAQALPSAPSAVKENSTQEPSSREQESQESLLTLRKQVNFVEVPVTVKDQSGELVAGLTRDDFQVLENGEPQAITFFSDGPLALSAAILVDLGIPVVEMQKVDQTLTSLIGAFGPFDEVALYHFSNTVHTLEPFTVVEDLDNLRLERSMKQLRRFTARQGGVPVDSGPMHSGPTISGKPVDPSVTTHARTQQRPSRVLNDAIISAANDLAQREPDRRKILFVISDGAEFGSRASDEEVLRVLLSHSITVFGIGVGGAAIPVYKDLQKVRVEALGFGHALPKYAAATGGQVFSAHDPRAIERSYGKASEQARYRYTLGYNSPRRNSGFRRIEVRVNQPRLKVLAREGYYPVPAAR